MVGEWYYLFLKSNLSVSLEYDRSDETRIRGDRNTQVNRVVAERDNENQFQYNRCTSSRQTPQATNPANKNVFWFG